MMGSGDAMSEEDRVQVVNSLGLHARAAVKLVMEANQFKSDIYLSREGSNEVNAKSIMGVLTLAASQGSEIRVRCDGADSREALDAIRRLFQSGFGEE
jgi:phosphotransferase system HPr (HPr) family protein